MYLEGSIFCIINLNSYSHLSFWSLFTFLIAKILLISLNHRKRLKICWEIFRGRNLALCIKSWIIVLDSRETSKLAIKLILLSSIAFSLSNNWRRWKDWIAFDSCEVPCCRLELVTRIKLYASRMLTNWNLNVLSFFYTLINNGVALSLVWLLKFLKQRHKLLVNISERNDFKIIIWRSKH